MNTLIALFFTVGMAGASADKLPQPPHAPAAQATLSSDASPQRLGRLQAVAQRRQQIELTNQWLRAMRHRPAPHRTMTAEVHDRLNHG